MIMKRQVNEKVLELSVDLEKLGKKSKKALWLDLAERVLVPVRKRAEVNVYELGEVAKKNSSKILVVPGKILGAGDANGKIEVACMGCSSTAKRKILKAGGKVLGIKELLASKPAASKVVIVE